MYGGFTELREPEIQMFQLGRFILILAIGPSDVIFGDFPSGLLLSYGSKLFAPDAMPGGEIARDMSHDSSRFEGRELSII